MITDTVDRAFDADCRRLVARLTLEATSALPISQRIMACHGLCSLFSDGSPERIAAAELEILWKNAEESQLTLTSLLLNEEP